MPTTRTQWLALLEDGLHDAELAAGGLYLDGAEDFFALAARALEGIARAVEMPVHRPHALDVLRQMVPPLEEPSRATWAAAGLPAESYGWSVVQTPPPIPG